MTELRPRFDLGRAHQALDIDYSVYPLRDRRTMLLTHLEDCIEPTPEPIPTVPDGLHLGLAAWTVLASLLGLLIAPQAWPPEIVSIALGAYTLTRYIRTNQPHRKEPR